MVFRTPIDSQLDLERKTERIRPSHKPSLPPTLNIKILIPTKETIMASSTTSETTSLTVASRSKERTCFLSLSHELRQKILLHYFEHTIVILRQECKSKYLRPEQVRAYDEQGKLRVPIWSKARSHTRVAVQVLRDVDVRILEDVEYVVKRLREEVEPWLAEKGDSWREDLGPGMDWDAGLDDRSPNVAAMMGTLDRRDKSRWNKMCERCLVKMRFW